MWKFTGCSPVQWRRRISGRNLTSIHTWTSSSSATTLSNARVSFVPVRLLVVRILPTSQMTLSAECRTNHCGQYARLEDNCFNLDLHQLIIGGKVDRDSPYDHVGDWTLGNWSMCGNFVCFLLEFGFRLCFGKAGITAWEWMDILALDLWGVIWFRGSLMSKRYKIACLETKYNFLSRPFCSSHN